MCEVLNVSGNLIQLATTQAGAVQQSQSQTAQQTAQSAQTNLANVVMVSYMQ